MSLLRIVLVVALGSGLAARPAVVAACGDGGLPEPVLFAARPYSSVAMTDALAALASCGHDYGDVECEPFSVIGSWGARAVPSLLAAAKRGAGAGTAAHLALLQQAKVRGSGLALHAIARSMKPDRIQLDLYRAAVVIDGTRAFEALAIEGETAGDAWTMELVAEGLAMMPEPAFAWVARELRFTARPFELARLAATLASYDTAAAILDLSTQTTDLRARIRLVHAAASYGATDDSTWTILHAGLTSRDGAIRDDARDHFLFGLVPPGRASEFLSIFEADFAGRALDRADARKLALLGSTREDVYDVLFDGLGSDSRSARFGAVMMIEKMATHVPPALRVKYIGLLEHALASSTDVRWNARVTKAIAALR